MPETSRRRQTSAVPDHDQHAIHHQPAAVMEQALILHMDERTRLASKTSRVKPDFCRYPVIGIPWRIIPYPDCPIALQETGYLGAHLQLGELAPTVKTTMRFSVKNPMVFLVFVLEGYFGFADQDGMPSPGGKAGTFYLAYNSGHTFSFTLDPGKHSMLLIALDRDWLLPTKAHYPAFNPLLDAWQSGRPGTVRLPPHPINTPVTLLLKSLRTTLVESLEQGISVTQTILAIINRYHALLLAESDKHRRENSRDAWHIRGYLLQRLQDTQACQTRQVALKLSLSLWRIRQLSKTYFGMALHEYYNKLRMMYARHLLVQTDLPIHEISYRCGFQDPPSLTRAFKHYFGKTPKAYKHG